MSAKCTSQNCNRKPESSNNQNLCILCFDWFQKCQDQNQASQQPQNYQELSNIYNNLANGVPVDPNLVMRALLGSMTKLMNQNVQIVQVREEISTVTNDMKDLENELSDTKLKLYKLEYDFTELENREEFSTRDSIVIRNVPVPHDGDDLRVVKEALAQLNIEDFVPEEDIKKVVRKGNRNGKLGSILVKICDENFKVKIMKNKKELKNHTDEEIKKLKIMNFKTQEQILYENALRSVLSVMPNGDHYELNGTMHLVSRR
jgi:hypothetical protein